MSDIMQRISKLEATNRRYRLALASGALILGVMFVMGQTAAPQSQGDAPKLIRATRFELADETGKTVGIWGSDSGGFVMGFVPQKPTDVAPALYTKAGGPAGLFVRDGKDVATISLASQSQTDASLLLLASPTNESVGASLNVDAKKEVAGLLFSQGRRIFAGFQKTKNQPPTIVLLDSNGNPLWGAP